MTTLVLLTAMIAGGNDYDMFDARVSKVEAKIAVAEKQIKDMSDKLDNLQDKLANTAVKAAAKPATSEVVEMVTECENGVCRLVPRKIVSTPNKTTVKMGSPSVMTYSMPVRTYSDSSSPVFAVKRGLLGVRHYRQISP
jgi:uncharacterized coiled-coil protein SlyX